MDRRSGSSAPFRITPASKPGAGGQDHWEGTPSWGNTHGAEWYELAGTETIPGTENVENFTHDNVYGPGGFPDINAGDIWPETVNGHSDWEYIGAYMYNISTDGSTSEYSYHIYLKRTSSSTPDTVRKIWNIYRYRFLQWMYQRQETRAA